MTEFKEDYVHQSIKRQKKARKMIFSRTKCVPREDSTRAPVGHAWQSRTMFHKNLRQQRYLSNSQIIVTIEENGDGCMRKYSVLMMLGLLSMLLLGLQLSALPATAPIIDAEVDIFPEVFNLKQKGVITAHIVSLTKDGVSYSLQDVNESTIGLFYEGVLIAEALRVTVGDDKVIARFDATIVADYIWLNVLYHMGMVPPQEKYPVPLTVSGELLNGEQFAGSDTIKVIHGLS
jgi:hypothetical protein